MPNKYPINKMRSRTSESIEGATRVTIARPQSLAHKCEVDVPIHEPQEGDPGEYGLPFGVNKTETQNECVDPSW